VGAEICIRDRSRGRGRCGLLFGGREHRARGDEHGLGVRMLLRNESEVCLHASGEAGLAQVVIVNLQALVSNSDERRLVAAIAGDADVDKRVLLGGALLLLLNERLRCCNCGLHEGLRVDGKGRVSLAKNLNGIVLRTFGRDAETALAGTND